MQTKNKTYKYGKFTFKSYYKTAGNGYEIGIKHGKSHIFMGNFVNKTEAEKWWKHLNQECKTFTKKFWINQNAPVKFYKDFFAKHLYSKYYTFLNKMFAEYRSTYSKSFQKDVKKYRTLKNKKNWTPKEAPHLKVA